jgi:hypothetical protein
LLIAIEMLLTFQLAVQEKLYLVFEFLKVDNKQETAYGETEEFWAKFHEQRVKHGDIIGWNLWKSQPDGEDQHFQYLTINLYNEPVKMITNADKFDAV